MILIKKIKALRLFIIVLTIIFLIGIYGLCYYSVGYGISMEAASHLVHTLEDNVFGFESIDSSWLSKEYADILLKYNTHYYDANSCLHMFGEINSISNEPSCIERVTLVSTESFKTDLIYILTDDNGIKYRIEYSFDIISTIYFKPKIIDWKIAVDLL